jgi:trk system potassium uptake protein TrkH
MDAETPGPGIQKLTPHIAETARALWIAYIAFTVLEFALLYGLHLVGLAPNMTLFNAVAHPLTTLPTGRFSPEARSIEAFAPIVQWIVIPPHDRRGDELRARLAGASRRPERPQRGGCPPQ